MRKVLVILTLLLLPILGKAQLYFPKQNAFGFPTKEEMERDYRDYLERQDREEREFLQNLQTLQDIRAKQIQLEENELRLRQAQEQYRQQQAKQVRHDTETHQSSNALSLHDITLYLLVLDELYETGSVSKPILDYSNRGRAQRGYPRIERYFISSSGEIMVAYADGKIAVMQNTTGLLAFLCSKKFDPKVKDFLSQNVPKDILNQYYQFGRTCTQQ